MPEIDLDTVVEEKSEFDAEVTASELLTTPEELVIPEETVPQPPTYRTYRYIGSSSQGATSSPGKSSPFRTSHSGVLSNVTEEEVEVYEEAILEVSDDEQLEFDDYFDEDDDLDEDDEDMEDDYDENGDDVETDDVDEASSSVSKGREREEKDGSSGSSDSDTVKACFPLSPKQTNKSPVGIHLSLKKKEGVKRRHSSPVKVNYGKNRGQPQRSSSKGHQSYTVEKKVENTLQLPANDYDYIDRELMPKISSPRRSHSVKYPNTRRATSFTGKKRHGESFKLRSKSFSRSISHVQDDRDARLKAHQRSASTSQELKNGVHVCDVHVRQERGSGDGRGNTEGERGVSDEVGTKAVVCEANALQNGSENEWPVPLKEDHHHHHRGTVKPGPSLVLNIDRKDHHHHHNHPPESPLKRVPLSPRADNGAGRTRKASRDTSQERVIKCHNEDNVVVPPPPTVLEINARRENFHKYGREDRISGSVSSGGGSGVGSGERDVEKSTLV